jgi:nicotinamidase-related amidase
VEAQQGVLGQDSMLPALAADSASVVAGIGRLLDAARAVDVMVVHATFEGWLGATVHDPAPLWRAVGARTAEWDAAHRDTQVLPELLGPGDLVLPRHHGLSPAWHSELLPVLRGHGVETVVLAGVSLNVALPLAAGDAVQEGFHVVVARDAVGGTPAEYGEQVLKHTMPMLGRVLTVEALVEAWKLGLNEA